MRTLETSPSPGVALQSLPLSSRARACSQVRYEDRSRSSQGVSCGLLLLGVVSHDHRRSLLQLGSSGRALHQCCLSCRKCSQDDAVPEVRYASSSRWTQPRLRESRVKLLSETEHAQMSAAARHARSAMTSEHSRRSAVVGDQFFGSDKRGLLRTQTSATKSGHSYMP